jgi:hypothetical protein
MKVADDDQIQGNVDKDLLMAKATMDFKLSNFPKSKN